MQVIKFLIYYTYMKLNFEKNNKEIPHPIDQKVEFELLMETYEILLQDAQKDIENLRRELDVVDQFEKKSDSFVMPARNRAEIIPILKQVRAHAIGAQEALRLLRKQYELIQAIIPNDPSLN